MPKFIAQRLLPGSRFTGPDQWIGMDAPGKDGEPEGDIFNTLAECEQNAVDRIQSNNFGVVTVFRIVQVITQHFVRTR
jgi:hypothetical protein